MKKLYKIIILTLCLLPCAFLLNACGETKTHNINVVYDDEFNAVLFYSEYSKQETEFGTTSSGIFENTIKHGNTETYSVVVRNDYELSSLKIFANGKQIDFEISPEYLDDGKVNQDEMLVGSITLTNVKDDITLSYQIEQKQVSFKFAVNPDAEGDTANTNSSLTADLVLPDNITLAYALQNSETYAYKTTYADLGYGVTLPVKSNSNKPYGYYNTNNVFYSQDLNQSISCNYGNYDINLMELKRNNMIYVTPSNFVINDWTITNGQSMYLDQYILQLGEDRTFSANMQQDKLVKLTLDADYKEVDLTNAELYLNETKIGKVNELFEDFEYTYTIQKGEYPLQFGQMDTTFAFYIKGAEINLAEDNEYFCLLQNIQDYSGQYYYTCEQDGVNKVYYIAHDVNGELQYGPSVINIYDNNFVEELKPISVEINNKMYNIDLAQDLYKFTITENLDPETDAFINCQGVLYLNEDGDTILPEHVYNGAEFELELSVVFNPGVILDAVTVADICSLSVIVRLQTGVITFSLA